MANRAFLTPATESYIFTLAGEQSKTNSSHTVQKITNQSQIALTTDEKIILTPNVISGIKSTLERIKHLNNRSDGRRIELEIAGRYNWDHNTNNTNQLNLYFSIIQALYTLLPIREINWLESLIFDGGGNNFEPLRLFTGRNLPHLNRLSLCHFDFALLLTPSTIVNKSIFHQWIESIAYPPTLNIKLKHGVNLLMNKSLSGVEFNPSRPIEQIDFDDISNITSIAVHNNVHHVDIKNISNLERINLTNVSRISLAPESTQSQIDILIEFIHRGLNSNEDPININIENLFVNYTTAFAKIMIYANRQINRLSINSSNVQFMNSPTRLNITTFEINAETNIVYIQDLPWMNAVDTMFINYNEELSSHLTRQIKLPQQKVKHIEIYDKENTPLELIFPHIVYTESISITSPCNNMDINLIFTTELTNPLKLTFDGERKVNINSTGNNQLGLQLTNAGNIIYINPPGD